MQSINFLEEGTLQELITTYITTPPKETTSLNSIVLKVHGGDHGVLDVVEGLKEFFLAGDVKHRAKAVKLLGSLLEKVKTLKLKEEAVLLFNFFVDKMYDNSTVKHASHGLLLILTSTFLTKKYPLNETQ